MGKIKGKSESRIERKKNERGGGRRKRGKRDEKEDKD